MAGRDTPTRIWGRKRPRARKRLEARQSDLAPASPVGLRLRGIFNSLPSWHVTLRTRGPKSNSVSRVLTNGWRCAQDLTVPGDTIVERLNAEHLAPRTQRVRRRKERHRTSDQKSPRLHGSPAEAGSSRSPDL